MTRLLLLSFLLFSVCTFAQKPEERKATPCCHTDKQGLKQGEWIGTAINPISYKGSYKDGKREGDWKWFTQNGELWIKANYIEGQLTSTVNYLEDATDFDSFSKFNGTTTDNDLPEKNKKWLRQSLLFEDTLYHYGKDVYTLKYIYVSQKGKRLIIEYLYDSPPDIKALSNEIALKHKDTKLKLLSSVIYKNEVPWKTIVLFNLKSKPLEPGSIEDGSGTWRAYHPSGEIYVTGHLKNGKKEGQWNYFNEDGKPLNTITYENNNKNGPCTEYYVNGNVKKELIYKNDTIKGLYKSYFENGNLRTEGKIRMAIEGLEVKGSEFSGIVFQEKNYTVFKGIGFWKFYYEDGRYKNQYLFNNESLWEPTFNEEKEVAMPGDFTR